MSSARDPFQDDGPGWLDELEERYPDATRLLPLDPKRFGGLRRGPMQVTRAGRYLNGEPVKRCSKCGVEKSTEDFYRKSKRERSANASPFGEVGAWCKDCYRAHQRTKARERAVKVRGEA